MGLRNLLLGAVCCGSTWAFNTVQAGGDVTSTVQKELTAALDSIIERPGLRDARLGVRVVRLEDGALLYERNSDALLIPASNVKLVTTAAALHYLGPDYEFRTVASGSVDDTGTVAGDLYLKGYGDPYLVPERVWYLAGRLRLAGIRHVAGDLVMDDSFFAGSRMANGADQDRSSHAYMAPNGALSVGFNAIQVHVQPGPRHGRPALVQIEPRSAYPLLKGRIRTVRRGRTHVRISIEPFEHRSIVHVGGRILADEEPRAYWRRIDNPPVFAGEVLREILGQIGITVQGGVREGTVPEDAPTLVTVYSVRLAELVGRLNKHSNNFMAAQVARTLGAELYGAPGTWEKAERALSSFLELAVGIAPGQYAVTNASGLHDTNRLTPHQIVELLQYMHGQPDLRPEFMCALAVAGGAGTLQDRMVDTEADRQLRAKTGTLSRASALSGYVTARTGEMLAFAFLVNDFQPSITLVWNIQDELGATLASLSFDGSTIGDSTAVSAATAAPQGDLVDSEDPSGAILGAAASEPAP